MTSQTQSADPERHCGSGGGPPPTTPNAQQVDFTVKYLQNRHLLVSGKTRKASRPYADFADLKGKNVVTTAGTTSERIIKARNADKQMGMNVISAKDHGESDASKVTAAPLHS